MKSQILLIQILLITAGLMISTFAISQETRTTNDIRDDRTDAFAFTHATIYPSQNTRLENATLLISDGQVKSIKRAGPVPEGYIELDMEGRFIYPGLIDIYTNYGLPQDSKSPKTRNGYAPENMQTTTPGAFAANEAIKSHYSAAMELALDKDAAKTLRALGFSSVLSFRADGVARGRSTLLTLGDNLVGDAMLVPEVAAHYSFNKGTSKQHFPSSQMGMVALLRQSFLDAKWYAAQNPKKTKDISLDAWVDSQALPQIFESSGWGTALVADRVGDEFGVQYIIKGAGDEYQRLDLIKATGAAFIMPLDFPEAMNLDNPIVAKQTSLAEMKHWELAPYNLSRMAVEKIPFALTSYKQEKNFWKRLKLAVKNGLDEDIALGALTSVPAKLLNQSTQIGSLHPGSLANFIITSGELFQDQTKIQENWIRGKKFVINKYMPERSGVYQLIAGQQEFKIEIAGDSGKYKAKLILPSEKDAASEKQSVGEKKSAGEKENKSKVKVIFENQRITINVVQAKQVDAIRLAGWQSKEGWQGRGQMTDGTWVDWSFRFVAPLAESDSDDKASDSTLSGNDKQQVPGKVIYPFVAFGRAQTPTANDFLIKNATVWTNEASGIQKNMDVLVQDGKIKEIGRKLASEGVPIIDASHQHLTSGIIDEHSHIALRAINDVATNSSMVRMRDVLDSEDINIYRNLAGGVTVSQLLHGSANPIGGQSAIVKLRWGLAPEQLLIEGADKFIKFALGENVKKSRNPVSVRYPQTRMGVEQVYMDAFGQAREYEKALKAYNNLSVFAKNRALKPRRNLVHETMLEVLDGKRFVTSHSYVQSEINMLMKVAEHYGFNINTFTHILEGYKVADKLAAHGAGGSTFADWWAYKWEVRYAIPYNAALMHKAGVVTAINSDDAEMSRRLNQEAAKTTRYGGLSEEEAWKLVTLNPAKLLHLDKRMGSIKVGKDADLVLWSDNPLSVYAKVNKTFVDGITYFDLDEDLKARAKLQFERNRLIQKIRKAKEKSKQDVAAKPKDSVKNSVKESASE